MTDRPEISVVLPMYNEVDAVEESLGVILEQMEQLGRTFEIVCVDDGSDDGTMDRLHAAAAGDPRVQPVQLSRNFGKEAALLAGLEVSRGEAVLLMDADLQHPPEVIPELVAKWEQGFDVVDAVKASRGRENPLYRLMAGTFNRMMGGAVGRGLQGASDFKLLDRQVVDALLRCHERARFFRGLVAWVGFRVAEVPFEVAERRRGESKWSTVGLIRYSVRNLLAFSSVPLRMVAWIGFFVVLIGLALGGHSLYNYFTGVAVTGFTTVILLVIILCGLILLSLGVVSLYLSQMYEEQKKRPVFIIRKDRSVTSGADSSAQN